MGNSIGICIKKLYRNRISMQETIEICIGNSIGICTGNSMRILIGKTIGISIEENFDS